MPIYRNVNNGAEILVESELSGDWELIEEKKVEAEKVVEDDEE